jgi:hypothetical protein
MKKPAAGKLTSSRRTPREVAAAEIEVVHGGARAVIIDTGQPSPQARAVIIETGAS